MKITRMSKLIAILIMAVFGSAYASAQQRTKVADGIYIATYGNVSVIENDNTQQTIQIKVVKKDDNLYDILCGDTVVKQVAKAGIRAGIAYTIQSFTSIPSWLSNAVIGNIVDKAYDSVCNYYK